MHYIMSKPYNKLSKLQKHLFEKRTSFFEFLFLYGLSKTPLPFLAQAAYNECVCNFWLHNQFTVHTLAHQCHTRILSAKEMKLVETNTNTCR